MIEIISFKRFDEEIDLGDFNCDSDTWGLIKEQIYASIMGWTA